MRVAVLLSGEGTSLENLVTRIQKGALDAEIVCVIASRARPLRRIRPRSLGPVPHKFLRSLPAVIPR